MNRYEVFMTNKFTTSLYSICDYLKFLSHSLSKEIISKTYLNISNPENFPFSNPPFILNNDDRILRKIIINKRYLILYSVIDNFIILLYFVDGRRSYENFFK